jgi:hypothetical protein
MLVQGDQREEFHFSIHVSQRNVAVTLLQELNSAYEKSEAKMEGLTSNSNEGLNGPNTISPSYIPVFVSIYNGR